MSAAMVDAGKAVHSDSEQMSPELDKICSSIDQILSSPLLALLHINLEDAEQKHNTLSTYCSTHLISCINISTRGRPRVDP
jgi:hypothetical protein